MAFYITALMSDCTQRADEQARKLKAVVEKTIGDRLPSMMYVDILATNSNSQGRGYGGMLLEAINDLVCYLQVSISIMQDLTIKTCGDKITG